LWARFPWRRQKAQVSSLLEDVRISNWNSRGFEKKLKIPKGRGVN